VGLVAAGWAFFETASFINACFAGAVVSGVFALAGFAISKVEGARFLSRLKTMRYLVCLRCGYELAETHTTCPECGRTYDARFQERLWKRRLSSEPDLDDDQSDGRSL
jgi:hypothetical protein